MTRTEIRREAQVVDVPVTTTRQVTVDEGSYQKVWVPKLVMKNVTETTVQKQVQYRDVPYQVVENRPLMTTPVTGQCCHGQLGGLSIAPAPISAVPQPTTAMKSRPIPDPYATAAGSSPLVDQQTPEAIADSEWSKVPARQKESKVELQSYETFAAPPTSPAGHVSRGVPSAVTAWRAGMLK